MPQRIRTGKLTRGQMGYVIAGLRDPREARPGELLSIVRLTDVAIHPTLSTRSYDFDPVFTARCACEKAEGGVYNTVCHAWPALCHLCISS